MHLSHPRLQTGGTLTVTLRYWHIKIFFFFKPFLPLIIITITNRVHSGSSNSLSGSHVMSLVVLVVIVLCEIREFPLQLCCPSHKESFCASHERGEACDGSPWAWRGLASRGVDPANAVLCDHCLIVGLGVPTGTLLVGTGQCLL